MENNHNQYVDFITNLSTVHIIINKRIDAALGSIHGITFTEYLILHFISKGHNKSIRRIDLAKDIGLTASGITRSLNPLEKIGLIKKESNQRDARVSLVKLTKSGERILEESSLTLNSKVQSLFVDLKEEFVENSLAVLHHLHKQNNLL